MKYLLWGIIALAVVLVAINKVRSFRKGKYCSCGCGECGKKCKEFKE